MRLPHHKLLLNLFLALAVAFVPMAGVVAAIDTLPLGQEAPCHHMAGDAGEADKHNCCEHHACQSDCSHCGQCLSVFVFGPAVWPQNLSGDLNTKYDFLFQDTAASQTVADLYRPPQFS